MIDTEHYNLRQLFLDFIDLGEDEEVWQRYLETYNDLLAEVKRLRERICDLEMSMEEYRQERPTEYCANCYAYIEEYDGDGVKECWCSDCEEEVKEND